MTNPTYGDAGISGTTGFAKPAPTNNLLQQVQAATTIEAGLNALRQGVANAIADGVGIPMLSEAMRNDPPGDGQGGEPAKSIQLDYKNLAALSQLHEELTTYDEVWAEALIANTPMADTTQEAQTASHAAFA